MIFAVVFPPAKKSHELFSVALVNLWSLGGGFKDFCLCSSLLGVSWSNLTCAYFSTGLVQPPTRSRWRREIANYCMFRLSRLMAYLMCPEWRLPKRWRQVCPQRFEIFGEQILDVNRFEAALKDSEKKEKGGAGGMSPKAFLIPSLIPKKIRANCLPATICQVWIIPWNP